jgi:hypothetical protein
MRQVAKARHFHASAGMKHLLRLMMVLPMPHRTSASFACSIVANQKTTIHFRPLDQIYGFAGASRDVIRLPTAVATPMSRRLLQAEQLPIYLLPHSRLSRRLVPQPPLNLPCPLLPLQQQVMVPLGFRLSTLVYSPAQNQWPCLSKLT